MSVRWHLVSHCYLSFPCSTSGTLLNGFTDTDATTPTLATYLSLGGDFFQSAAFAFGRLYG